MTNLIIRLILAYTEYLTALEAHKRKQAANTASTARVYYIHNRADAIAAERTTLEAMLRVYLARPQGTRQQRKAA